MPSIIDQLLISFHEIIATPSLSHSKATTVDDAVVTFIYSVVHTV